MLKMRKMIGLVVTVLFMSGLMGMTSLAAENPDISETGFKLTKYLQIDKNVKHIPNLQFDFTIQQLITEEDFKDAIPDEFESNWEDSWSKISTAAVGIQQGTVSISLPTGVTTEYYFGATKSTADHENLYERALPYTFADSTGDMLEASDFPKEGLYAYKITENAVNLAAENSTATVNKKITPHDELICSKAEYVLLIPVGWNIDYSEKKFVMEDVIILQTKDQNGKATGVKVASMDFINTYQRNDSDEFGLEISKEVQGVYANPQKEFTFSIDINRNATESASVNGYQYAIYNRVYEKDANGALTGKYTDTKITNSEKTVLFEPEEGTNQTFKLKHNQVLKFDKFPVGTTYTFTEDAGGYTPEAEVTEGTVRVNTINSATGHVTNGILNGAKGEKRDEPFVIHEGQDTVEVTNIYEISPITGAMTDNLSFNLLIIVAIVGMIGYTLVKKSFKYD